MKLKKQQQEFIKQAYDEVCSDWKLRIKEVFPDLFENELEVGRWYKHKYQHGTLLVFNGGEITYGFWDGKFAKDWSFSKGNNSFTPATKEEVEKALIKEAKKRGYNKNNFNSLSSLSDTNFEGWHYCSFTERLYSANEHCGGKVVFEKGRWAEIIETITKEEAEKQLGKKIID